MFISCNNNDISPMFLIFFDFFGKNIVFWKQYIDIFGQHQNYRHYFNNIEIFLLMRSHYEWYFSLNFSLPYNNDIGDLGIAEVVTIDSDSQRVEEGPCNQHAMAVQEVEGCVEISDSTPWPALRTASLRTRFRRGRSSVVEEAGQGRCL